jgi:hypothetical protein
VQYPRGGAHSPLTNPPPPPRQPSPLPAPQTNISSRNHTSATGAACASHLDVFSTIRIPSCQSHSTRTVVCSCSVHVDSIRLSPVCRNLQLNDGACLKSSGRELNKAVTFAKGQAFHYPRVSITSANQCSSADVNVYVSLVMIFARHVREVG